VLPNFLCLGAQKAGTTTLWHILNQHPDIYLPDNPRETKFFTHERFYARGISYYELFHFANWNGQKAVGEKTPEYLFHKGVPERINKTLGADIKFIVSLRSPSQRAFSQFRHNYQGQCENLDFNQALYEEERRVSQSESHLALYGYLARGYYYEQIIRYLNVFPRERFLFLVFEKDILGNQEITAKKIFNLLEVEVNVDLQLPVRSGRPTISVIRYADKEFTINLHKKALNKDITLDKKIFSWFENKFKNKTENTNDLTATTFVVPEGCVVITRQTEDEFSQPVLVHKPSTQLIEFAKLNEKNKPESKSLSNTLEVELNKKYFREDILILEDLLNLDLGHWLGR
jgi:hypothetical protein